MARRLTTISSDIKRFQVRPLVRSFIILFASANAANPRFLCQPHSTAWHSTVSVKIKPLRFVKFALWRSRPTPQLV
ncbi:hypothetical protein J1614_005594 [Plenodomus biglobosus]|nr:hypothetical protein J1614_005594 [Plenodomus biglobosus]